MGHNPGQSRYAECEGRSFLEAVHRSLCLYCPGRVALGSLDYCGCRACPRFLKVVGVMLEDAHLGACFKLAQHVFFWPWMPIYRSSPIMQCIVRHTIQATAQYQLDSHCSNLHAFPTAPKKIRRVMLLRFGSSRYNRGNSIEQRLPVAPGTHPQSTLHSTFALCSFSCSPSCNHLLQTALSPFC